MEQCHNMQRNVPIDRQHATQNPSSKRKCLQFTASHDDYYVTKETSNKVSIKHSDYIYTYKEIRRKRRKIKKLFMVTLAEWYVSAGIIKASKATNNEVYISLFILEILLRILSLTLSASDAPPHSSYLSLTTQQLNINLTIVQHRLFYFRIRIWANARLL